MSPNNEADCVALNENSVVGEGTYCDGFWEVIVHFDGVCWPNTPENNSVSENCPDFFAFDTNHFATRFCNIGGSWANVSGLFGGCLSDETRELMEQEFQGQPELGDLRFVADVINGSRILEIVGYSISLACLLVAFFIFCYFRSLQCERTTIHKQLFLSLLIRTVLDIILYVDNTYRMQEFTTGHKPPSIGKVKGLCETFEYFRQYTRFCVFSWMFVEGLYLNGMITAAVFQKPNFKLYYFIGWILPLFPVTAWAITMKFTTEQACWFGYVKSPYYWIVEIPRNLILLINLGFLINIIRILVTKLRESNTSETQQLRKAVKAAILLAPLLGVTNLLFLPDNPKSHESRVVIVLYFYGVMIVTPFQGVIVSLLHCFVNGEVRLLLRRKWAGWKSSRQPGGRLRRQSNSTTTDVYRLNSIYSTTETIRMSFVKHSTQLPQQPSSPVLASPSLSANSPSPSPPPSPGGIAGGPDPASAEDVSTSLL